MFVLFVCQYIYARYRNIHIHREDVCKIYESEFSSSLSMIFTLHFSDILHQEFLKPSVFPRFIKYLLVYDENI